LAVPRKAAETANRIAVGTLNPDKINVDKEGWRLEIKTFRLMGTPYSNLKYPPFDSQHFPPHLLLEKPS
jgi:hypothetical protein